MTPTPQHHKHESPRDVSLGLRYLARAHGYEIALIMPPPAPPPGPPVEPLVRLRFLGEQVEVVLTPAKLVALSVDLKQLLEYLQIERTRRSHHT
jgi:hypothetical protein